MFASALRSSGECVACGSKLTMDGKSVIVDLVSNEPDKVYHEGKNTKARPLAKWEVPKLKDLRPGDAVYVRLPLSSHGKYTKVQTKGWLTGKPFKSRTALTRAEKSVIQTFPFWYTQ